MPVMATGVHNAFALGWVSVRAGFMDRQRIHICAQPNRPIATARFQNANHAHALMYFKAKAPQQLRDAGLGLHFLKPKFGFPVKRMAQSGKFNVVHGVASL
jgi:hypothetical protein